MYDVTTENNFIIKKDNKDKYGEFGEFNLTVPDTGEKRKIHES